MLRTTALIAILLCLCSCTTPPAEQAAERPPNFVLIFIDDMGYGDIGPFGSTVHRTPHLDRMARYCQMLWMGEVRRRSPEPSNRP